MGHGYGALDLKNRDPQDTSREALDEALMACILGTSEG